MINRLTIIYLSLCSFIFIPVKINQFRVDLRAAKWVWMLTFFFGLVIALARSSEKSTLRNNKWICYLMIWFVANFWIHFFLPTESFGSMVKVLTAFFIVSVWVGNLASLDMEFFFKLMVATGVVQVFWVILQYYHLDPLFLYISVSGNVLGNQHQLFYPVGFLGNPSLLGAYLAILIPMAWVIKEKWAKYLAMLILFVGVLVCGASLSILAAGAGIIFLVATNWTRRIIVFLAVPVMGLLVFSYTEPGWERLEVWSFSSRLLTETWSRIFLGMGFGGFAALGVIKDGGQPWREMHNDILQLWFEQGLIGFSLFSIYVVGTFRRIWSLNQHPMVVSISASAIAFLIISIGLFPMQQAALATLGMLLVAAAHISITEEEVV